MKIINYEVQIERPQVIQITEADGGIWAVLKPDAFQGGGNNGTVYVLQKGKAGR